MEPNSNQPPNTTRIKRVRQDRGSAGLGTLLLFIVMVIIAAVCAGVLINVTGVLETSADSTPQTESTHPIQVIEKTGQVTSNDPVTVHTIVLTVKPSPDHETLDLANLTIEWFGPTGHTTLRYGGATETNTLSKPATEFAVGTKQDADNSHPEMNAATDRFTIKIDVAAVNGNRGLSAATTAAVKITTGSGTTHFVTLESPSSLEPENAVAL